MSFSGLSRATVTDLAYVEALARIYPHTGRAHVVGFTGPPGVGKSSLINRLVRTFRSRGKSVGVVAVGLQASGNLSHDGTVGAVFGTPAWVGRVFLVDHLLAFEITSVVLLIAAVGGVILGSHTRREAA